MKVSFMQRMKRTLLAVALVLGFSFVVPVSGGALALGSAPLTNPAPIIAATSPTPQSTVCDSIGAGTDCNSSGGGNLSGVIKLVVNILSVLAGTLAVIMIILAGMKYITAAGDSSKITSAKNTLVYAIIGIIIVVLAQFIVQFVIGKTSSAVQCPAGKTYDKATSTCK